jgi:hypothetical protein
MTEPTIKQLSDKLSELIVKHNELAYAVDNLTQAIEAINITIFSQGEKPKELQ